MIDSTAKNTLSRSEQKHQDIVAAAEQVFIEYGYHQASMNKIAEVAQVTKRTIYKKFSSKEALFDFIIRTMINGMYEQVNLPYDSNKDLKPQLITMINMLWNTMSSEKHAKLKRVIIAEYIRVPGFILPTLAELTQRDEGLASWLQQAIDCGHLSCSNKQFMFEFIVGMVARFTETPLIFDQKIPKGKSKDTIIAEIADLIIQKYAA